MIFHFGLQELQAVLSGSEQRENTSGKKMKRGTLEWRYSNDEFEADIVGARRTQHTIAPSKRMCKNMTRGRSDFLLKNDRKIRLCVLYEEQMLGKGKCAGNGVKAVKMVDAFYNPVEKFFPKSSL